MTHLIGSVLTLAGDDKSNDEEVAAIGADLHRRTTRQLGFKRDGPLGEHLVPQRENPQQCTSPRRLASPAGSWRLELRTHRQPRSRHGTCRLARRSPTPATRDTSDPSPALRQSPWCLAATPRCAAAPHTHGLSRSCSYDRPADFPGQSLLHLAPRGRRIVLCALAVGQCRGITPVFSYWLAAQPTSRSTATGPGKPCRP